MGLRADIQTELTAAMDDDLADVVENFNFRVFVSEGTYDSAKDSRTPVYANSPCRGIFKKVNPRHVDGINIKARDEICIVNGTDAMITPLIDMQIVMVSNSKKYRIIDPGKVTGGSSPAIIYKMQIRADEPAIR